MKTSIYQSFTLLFCLALLAFSCQNKEEMLLDPDADAPEIGTLALDKAKLTYGDSVISKITITDAAALSHVEIKLTANNSVIYSKVFPGRNQSSITIEDTIRVPFDRLCGDQIASIVITATNKNIKMTEKSFDLPLERPAFDQLYLVIKETGDEIVLEKDDSDPLNPYRYKATTELPNGTDAFIYSQTSGKGFAWGFNNENNTCDLTASVPISLYDSQSNDEKVRDIVFDAFSFEITPLKKEMTVNDVVFLLYKKNPSDNSSVKNVLRALNVPLTNGGEVRTDLVDLNTVTFDPDYFEINDGKLIYTGQSGNVTLYLNTLFNFVFVENPENPLATNSTYPNVLFVNGWGIGRPELWGYNPDWSFDHAIVFRKVSENETETVYCQTVIVSKWVQFKFYNQKDWGGEFSCPAILFEDNHFKALEESGKPGNYNLVTGLGDDTAYKSAVAKMTFIVPKSGNATRFKSVILAESDQD